MSAADLKELLQFMQPNQRLDLKAVATAHILALTGSVEGKSAILGMEEMLMALFALTGDANTIVAKDAVLALINLTADAKDAVKVFETADSEEVKRFPIVENAVNQILNQNSELAQSWTMVLSNLTRVETLVPAILDKLENMENALLRLAEAFANIDYNKKNAKLHYLGPFFCNLTQTNRGREIFCHAKYNLMDKVLPFASYDNSLIRRGGVVGLLKNICSDAIYHELLLGEREDILCAMLYPLCGPEEYTDEENEMLPIELQYLPETKSREEDPDLRKMLLEALLQLCATRRFRELLRAKGVYEVLREYHKWEARVGKDSECLLACENVVDILIKKEEEIGLDNYKEVDVPNDVAEKFVKEDTEYLKDLV